MKKFSEWLLRESVMPDWLQKEINMLSFDDRKQWDQLMGTTDQDKINYFQNWFRSSPNASSATQHEIARMFLMYVNNALRKTPFQYPKDSPFHWNKNPVL